MVRRTAVDRTAHRGLGRRQRRDRRFAEADDALDAGDDALQTIDHGDQARREFVDAG